MKDDRKKKVYATTSNGSLTRLANKYSVASELIKVTIKERNSALTKLRDSALSYFSPDDENSTRVLQTRTLDIIINKRTFRKVAQTDMEKVFKSISEAFGIPREKLDKIVESNTVVTAAEVKPTVKVRIKS